MNQDPETTGAQPVYFDAETDEPVTGPPGDVEDMQSLMDSEEAGFRSLRRRQTTSGIVVSIGEDALLIDVGTKSEGIVPREELAEFGEELPELHIGDEVMVQVLDPEGREGPILSLRRARREQAWVDMEHFATEGRTIEAPVVDHNRGGVLLDVRGLRGFVPISQLVSLSPASRQDDNGEDTQERLARLHGQRLNVKVLEVSSAQNRLILSERAAQQETRAQRRVKLLNELAPGQIRRGKVRSVTSFGAFVDLGGIDGLVHVSELSYDRVQDPRKVLEVGQELDVYVLDVRPGDQRISLSLKRAQADPWQDLESRHQAGEILDATITRLAVFGAFAQIEPGVEGLIHLTELAENTPREASQVVHQGQTVPVKIIHIDSTGRRLGLSIRQVQPVETQMTPEEWAATQEQDREPVSSAFDALAGLAGNLGSEPEAAAPPADHAPESGTAAVAPPTIPDSEPRIEEEQAGESKPSESLPTLTQDESGAAMESESASQVEPSPMAVADEPAATEGQDDEAGSTTSHTPNTDESEAGAHSVDTGAEEDVQSVVEAL